MKTNMHRPPGGSAGTQKACEWACTGHQVAVLGHSKPVNRNAQEILGYGKSVNPLEPWGDRQVLCSKVECYGVHT